MADALDRIDVAYFLGGSLASSYQGEPRATNAVDLVVDLGVDDVAALSAALGEAYLVDEAALREAVDAGRAWNIVHLPSVTTVALIPRGDGPFDESEFSRRRRVEVRPGRELWMKSAEDTVIRKLLWYRDGGCVSERQWRDVVGVLRHSGALLDEAYLDGWVARLSLQRLFDGVRRDARDAGAGT